MGSACRSVRWPAFLYAALLHQAVLPRAVQPLWGKTAIEFGQGSNHILQIVQFLSYALLSALDQQGPDFIIGAVFTSGQ
jgi:hypothetical protein